MATQTARFVRMGTATLFAAFALVVTAGCGGGGLGVEIVPVGNPPPEPPVLQGVSIQCDPTSLVVLESVDIQSGGTTIWQPVNLGPGQQAFVDLPVGSYDLFGYWSSGGWTMKDSTPLKFHVAHHQVAFVSWK